MKPSKINWEIVEKIAESTFSDEYETTTRKQRESMELRISQGQPPVIQDKDAGGMHQYFGAGLENMGMILTAISIIVTWYTWSHPKPQNVDYQEFLRHIKEDSELMQLFSDTMSSEVIRIIENKFTPILEKLIALFKETEESNIEEQNNIY